MMRGVFHCVPVLLGLAAFTGFRSRRRSFIAGRRNIAFISATASMRARGNGFVSFIACWRSSTRVQRTQAATPRRKTPAKTDDRHDRWKSCPRAAR